MQRGVPTQLRVARPLGLGLDEQAFAAAQQWRFTRMLLLNRPLPVTVTIPVNFLLPTKFSRWHLTDVAFNVPIGGTRPAFIRVPYPFGAGVSRRAIEQAQVVAAIGRHAA